MATGNAFDILGDDDNDDLSQLIAKQEKKIQSKKAATPAAAAPAPAAPATSKFPSKPTPPTQAGRDARGNNTSRGGFGRGGSGRGGGRGGSERPREFRSDNSNGFNDRAPMTTREESGDANKSYDGQHHSYRGPRRGDYQEGDSSRPRRAYERHSGTGRGNEVTRQGSGRGNWGSVIDEPVMQDGALKNEHKVNLSDKPTEEAVDAELKDNKDEAANEAGEKEAEEDKEMTLEEYEKLREENRKALLASKTEERKVEIDKDLQSMQLLSTKKSTEEVFVKLGSSKDQKKRDAEKDERAKKSVSITEFLKPAEGERYYGGTGARGRGSSNRGRGRGGYYGGGSRAQSAPAIEDQLQFPTLGGK